MQIKAIYDKQCGLGEGPIWHAAESMLYWVDIRNRHVHRYDPKTQQHQQWELPGVIGCIAPAAQGGFIAGYKDKIAHINLETGHIEDLFGTQTGIRMNDGICDRQGRFWVGQADESGKGKLFRYSADGQCKEMEENITVSNGLDWSLDNKTFYYTDSPERKIYAYDFDVVTGDISNRRVFVDVPEAHGYPDGLTVDAEGYIWSAKWQANRIIRYTPEGNIDREIEMPVWRPTSVMFGGDNLDTLYVTSASCDLDEDTILDTPNGYVYAIENIGVKGVLQGIFGKNI